MEFDEELAIKFIRNFAQENTLAEYDDDEILNVIDIIWDYYEDNGMLEISDDTDDDIIEIDELIGYVKSMLRKDKSAAIKDEHVADIVKGELAYENTLEQE